MKQIIEKEYNRFDVKVISFGIDLKLFKPKKNKSKFIVGTIKSLESHNGIDCLIDAAELVVKRYNNKIDFQIIGKGLLKDEMEQRVKNLNIDKNVKFLGFVPHKSVVEYYNCFSIFVVVSTRESFGVSVLEAAACEIPSITSNVGGLKEVNKNNETGIIVEPNDPISLADSIINLYEQNSLRLKLGENARKRVIKKFNWQENLNQMIRVYKHLQNIRKIKSISTLKSLFLLSTIMISCDNTTAINNQYIDPQIIFSSRRWWNYDIFISDIYSGQITQLTKNKWIDFNPSISADSKKLLFVSDRDGNRDIHYQLRVDGWLHTVERFKFKKFN